MPMQSSQIMQNLSPPFPALFLFPLNDSFIPKNIALLNNQHVKIGRQTNAKTLPGERNGYFDSKVLSRQHAEVWEENGKIFIKDVKSSNGTFINAERLSAEGLESDPFELKSDDIVEFGIDIVGEDNKTIIHHKVAARVACVFSEQEAAAAQREAYNYAQTQHQSNGGPSGALGGTVAHKRPMLQPQQNSNVGIMGGMGGGARQPGSRNGLTFDHILQRLSGELQKSRETSAELGAVAGTMGEIENVMGGGSHPNLPPYPHVLPAVRPPSQHPQQPSSQSPPSSSEQGPSLALLTTLQAQLSETQSTLHQQEEKVRSLESLLGEQDSIKRDVSTLRDFIEEQRERQRMSQHMRDEEDDDDDARSVCTVVPRELETVHEEDEGDGEESEEERSARREELGRPRTPEPSSLGMHDDEFEHGRRRDGTGSSPSATNAGISEEMTRRLTFLSEQLESALELSRSLQEQHSAAQQTIGALESKVSSLEELVRATQSSQAIQGAQHAEAAVEREKSQKAEMSSMLDEFKKTFEERWDAFKSELSTEREKIREATERRLDSLEDNAKSSSGKFELGLAGLSSQISSIKSNGFMPVKSTKHTNGLVTPPSPRSLSDAGDDSSESDPGAPPHPLMKRKRSRSHRGRTKVSSRSRSPATSTSATLVDGASAPESSVASLHSRRSSADSPTATRDPRDGQRLRIRGGKDIESDSKEGTKLALDIANFKGRNNNFLPTPQASIHLDDGMQEVHKDVVLQQPHAMNMQVAAGVFVLGFATAAVVWRIKE